MSDLAQMLAAGPGTFPHAIDPARDMLLLVGLSEQQIHDASFLDQRVLTPQSWGRWLPFSQIEALVPRTGRDDAHYIFHIGHVGSTLISRLLGELPHVLAVREPQSLRDLADILGKRDGLDLPWNPNLLADRSALLRRLLARTFRADQRAIVKATSFTSEIAPALVADDARVLLLHVSPWSYMTTVLAGETSRQETGQLAGARLLRLARRIDATACPLWSLDEGEKVAMSWLSEMLSLQAAANALGDERVLWLDFDQFLADPAARLHAIIDHFGLGADAETVRRLIESAIMQRYSKAPEHGYSADLRRQLQQEAAARNAGAMRAGLDWLARLAKEDAKVAAILRRAATTGAPA